MLLNGKQAHIAYRCPGCGYAILGFVGSFSTSLGSMKLKCQCGESEMTIQFTDDKKVRLTVPCLLCGTSHNYTVSQSVFFGRELFMLNCPYTNMDICFIGQKDQLDGALERSADELALLFEEYGTDGEADGPTPEQLLPDAQVYDILRFVVKELEAEGGIECPCRKGPYEMDLTEEGIRVYCTECGASYTFAAKSVTDAEAFLHCDGLVLTYTP